MSRKNLNKIISELVKEVEDELEEATATGNIDGYQTPKAFGDDSEKSKKKTKQVATVAGYELVNESYKSLPKNAKDFLKIFPPDVLIKNSKADGTLIDTSKFNKALKALGIGDVEVTKYGNRWDIVFFDKDEEEIGELENITELSRGNVYSSQQWIKKPNDNIVKGVKILQKKHPKFDIKLIKHNSEFDKSKYGTATLSITGKDVEDNDEKSLESDIKKYLKESVSLKEYQKRRFEIDFYKGNSDRETSREEIIFGYKFSDVVSYATKIAKSKGFGYAEIHYKDNYIGSIDKRDGYSFKKGSDYNKSPLSLTEARKSGDTLKHKHQKGISITLVEPTNKGWKVKQTDYYSPGGRKLNKPKEKVAFYNQQDIESLFEGEGRLREKKVKKKRVNRWLELKNDDSMTEHQKLATGLKKLKYQLSEVEKFLGWYNKLKNINELESDNYWKRTNKNIYKMKERIINIAKKLQEIEK